MLAYIYQKWLYHLVMGLYRIMDPAHILILVSYRMLDPAICVSSGVQLVPMHPEA